MANFLTTVFTLIVALSVLVAVHEFGHYWVARRLGVKVLRFSIGFGKPLWTVRRGADQTEYMVSAIPLGGYVKMLDEREGEVAPEEAHRAFNRQKVWKRFAVVVAGPLFNLLFAAVFLWAAMVIGLPGLRPVVGDVEPGSIGATAGFQRGMEIVAVGGEPTRTFDEVFEQLVPGALHRAPVELTVAFEGQRKTLRLPFDQMGSEFKPDDLPTTLGIAPWYPPIAPVVSGFSKKDSVAESAGIRQGDRILAVNHEPIRDWSDMTRIIRAHPGQALSIELKRGAERMTVEVTPEAVVTKKGTIGVIGATAMAEQDPTMRVTVRYGVLEAVGAASSRTLEMSWLILTSLKDMVVGKASLDNISGPITIAQYAKSTAEAGPTFFLRFLALVSISLGVLNLLPIPVLDGGHLMLYVVEMVKGSPVSLQTEMVAQKVGLTLILMLMAIAFYNDLSRLAA